MLVIITEDSKSGFQFWSYFKRLVLKDSKNVEIVVARPKNHVDFGGSNTELGGIGNVLYELNYQLNRLSSITGNHLIFLGIDYIDDTTKDAYKTINNISDFVINYKNKKIAKYLNINNVRIEYSHYYCYEEIFLSFKYLSDFLNLKNNSSEVKKALQIYKTIYNYLCNLTKGNVYYNYLRVLNNNQNIVNIDKNGILYFLYRKYKKKYKLSLDKMRNRETVAALCLEYITSVNDKYLLKISKRGIGPCWFNDCYYLGFLKQELRKIGKLSNNKDCNGCLLCTKCKKGSQKMGMLLFIHIRWW